MCGRFQLNQDAKLVAQYFNAQTQFHFGPRYNIAPRQDVAVIRNSKEGRLLVAMNWGLVPSWTTDIKTARRPINARNETVATSGMFRRPLAQTRCLVPSSGFYEWQELAPKHKVPYLITIPHLSLYAMAGLYDNWCDPDGQWRQTVAIITTEPNSLVAGVHDRMPVVLSRDDEKSWLDSDASLADLQPLLLSYPASEMCATAISTRINNVANEGPEVVAAP